MQGTEVLVTLAEIAGVFVGFGALIAVRSGGPSDATEVSYIRMVLTIGVWVVVAGLVPATLSVYDLGDHGVWLASSLIALVGIVVLWAMNYRTADMQARTHGRPEAAGYALLAVAILAALVLVVLGLFPEQESALYLTAVVLGLFLAALTLLWLVFSHRGPTTVAPDKAELPAE